MGNSLVHLEDSRATCINVLGRTIIERCHAPTAWADGGSNGSTATTLAALSRSNLNFGFGDMHLRDVSLETVNAYHSPALTAWGQIRLGHGTLA